MFESAIETHQSGVSYLTQVLELDPNVIGLYGAIFLGVSIILLRWSYYRTEDANLNETSARKPIFVALVGLIFIPVGAVLISPIANNLILVNL